MNEQLEFMKETYEFNKEDIRLYVETADELITSDFLKAVGYDRRRVRNIKRIKQPNDTGYIWVISDPDSGKNIFAVKTMPSSWDVSQNTVINIDVPYLIISNSQQLGLFSGSKLVKTYSLFDDNSDIDELMDALRDNGHTLPMYATAITEKELRDKFETSIRNLDARFISTTFCQKMKVTPDQVISYLKDMLGESKPNTGNSSELEGQIKDQSRIIDELNAKVVELQDKVTSTSDELNVASETNARLQSELDSTRAELVKLQDAEPDNSIAEAEQAKAEAEQAKAETARVNKAMSDLEEKAVEKDAEIAELKSSLEQLKSELGSAKDSYDNISNELLNSNTECDRLSKLATELQDELNALKSAENTPDESGKIDSNLESKYRQQIVDLSNKLSSAEDEVKEYKKRIHELEEQIENKVDPRITEAESLLATVEADENDTKGFVGVVEGSLYQAQTIEKFVGLSLQELYKHVTFDLMQYLFDGDVFNISDNPIRNDMLIGNKMYDIDLSNISEEESINRLKTLFSKFPAVVFRYKIVGSVPAVDVEYANTDEEIHNDGDLTEQPVQDTNSDNTISDEVAVEIPFESMCSLMNSNTVDFHKYYRITNLIGDAYVCYDFDTEDKIKAIAQLFAAVVCFGEATDKAKAIGSYNFAEVISYPSNHGNGARVPFTGFFVDPNSYVDISNVLYKLCDICGVNSASLTVYGDCDLYIDEDAMYNLGIQSIYTSDIPVSVDNTSVKTSGNNSAHCIVSGTISKYIYADDDDLCKSAKLDIIKRVIAIKSGSIKYAFNFRDENEVAMVISEMLADSDIPIDEVISKLDKIPVVNHLDDSVHYYPVVSPHREEMPHNPDDIEEFNLNGDTYYVLKVEPSILMDTLIKIRLLASGDRNIGLRVVIDLDALNFYCVDYHNNDPMIQLSVSSLADYMIEHKK